MVDYSTKMTDFLNGLHRLTFYQVDYMKAQEIREGILYKLIDLEMDVTALTKNP